MANRPALMTKADATRLFKAARDSGYRRARVISHPDGRIEMVAEDLPEQKEQPADWDEVLN